MLAFDNETTKLTAFHPGAPARFSPSLGWVILRHMDHEILQDFILKGYTFLLQFVQWGVDTILTVRHGGAPFWSFDGQLVQLHPRVVHTLYQMGFYGVARRGRIDIDNHLITTLVERWRPETHTFHLPVGEAKMTLQDIAIMWGLPVEGLPVIARDLERTMDEWMLYCQQWLGFAPTLNMFRGASCLKLVALRSYFEYIVIAEYTPQLEVEQYARGIALLLIGSFLMPDSSGNNVSLHYLEQLQDASQCSCGSVILAVLYRELCTITVIVPRTIRSRVPTGRLYVYQADVDELPFPSYGASPSGYALSPSAYTLGPSRYAGGSSGYAADPSTSHHTPYMQQPVNYD
ncbi:hypothetical protein DH2020_034996 [Rehmannia glutinosa]|uniref:Aminotransferase-like plant mobile domain-containing protein n=1 Tax=Rehmannia glutinosa TaxID=99300 RepID=A0ABR0VAW3_REHGL